MGRTAALVRIGPVVVAAVVFTLAACTSSGGGQSSPGSFEARPLVMPAQHATHIRPHPFGSLHVPADEPAYSRMSRGQRADLVKALRGVDCAHPPTLSGTAA